MIDPEVARLALSLVSMFKDEECKELFKQFSQKVIQSEAPTLTFKRMMKKALVPDIIVEQR